MIKLSILFIVHYIFDYLFQFREMAENKSKDKKVLFEHMFIYGTGMTLAFMLISNTIWQTIFFGIILTAIHGVQDWYIWRWYKILVIEKLGLTGMSFEYNEVRREYNDFKYWEDKTFYDFIGLDSLLHALTIVILYSIFI